MKSTYNELMNKIKLKREIIDRKNEIIAKEEAKIKEIYKKINPLHKEIIHALDELDAIDFDEITVRFGDLRNEIIKLHKENGQEIFFDIHTTIRKYTSDSDSTITTPESLMTSVEGHSLIINVCNKESKEQLYSFYAGLTDCNIPQADGSSLSCKAKLVNNNYYTTVEFENYDDILLAISYKTMKKVSSIGQINFFEAIKLSEYTPTQDKLDEPDCSL